MPTVSTPVLAYAASIVTGQGVKYSTSFTSTLNITGGWEVQVPVWAKFSAVSADVVVNLFPSNDGGVTFDTAPLYALTVPRVQAGQSTASARIPTGMYAVEIKNNAHQSASFQILTQQIVTAIQNV